MQNAPNLFYAVDSDKRETGKKMNSDTFRKAIHFPQEHMDFVVNSQAISLNRGKKFANNH